MTSISQYQHKTNPDCPCVKTHGTASAYAKRGCRCPEAVAAYDDLKRRNREKWRWRHRHRRGGAGEPAPNRVFLPEDGILDEVAIECMVTGSRMVRRTLSERDEAVRRLILAGYEMKTIGERAYTTAKVVRRTHRELKSPLSM